MSTGALLSGDEAAEDVAGVALIMNADSLEYSSRILSSIFTRILQIIIIIIIIIRIIRRNNFFVRRLQVRLWY